MTTNYRPTPLQHYMFPVGGDGLQMVVDEASNFREDSFQRVRLAPFARGVECLPCTCARVLACRWW